MSAPTDCRGADQFQPTHRSGYHTDKLAWLMQWLTDHPDATLASGEGRVLRDEIVRLRARNATLTEATQAFTAWLASENTGPDYGGTYRDTPTGEQIWRAWYDNNLHLCAEALRLGSSALGDR
jgi:hypothetical protein